MPVDASRLNGIGVGRTQAWQGLRPRGEMLNSLSDRPRKRVAAWQEHAYGQLSQAMRLGWNPEAAFAALRAPTPRDASDSTAFAKRLFGEAVPNVDWDDMQQKVEEQVASYRQEADGPFEDPSFAVQARHFLHYVLEAPVWEGDYSLRLKPFIASLPSIGFNPFTRAFPHEGEAVILMQHDVFMFLHEMASTVAATLPWDWFPPKGNLYLEERDSMLRPGSAINVMRAREHFTSALYDYVTRGTSRSIPPLPLSGMAQNWEVELYQSAGIFIVAHEVAHIAQRHLPRKAGVRQEDAWSRETDADILGTIATVLLFPRTRVHPQIATLGCALALLTGHAVQLGVHYLEAGNTRLRPGPTHPPGPHRANVAVNAISMPLAHDLSDNIGNDFYDKLHYAVQLIQNLVNRCVADFKTARRSGARPSPVWRLGAPPDMAEGTK